MPGPITHLKAVYLYNKAHSECFGPAIYLGAISPDSVNINGHAPKAIRWPAHLRVADLDAWTENAREFYNNNKGKTDEDFLKGYILHIITDILWDKEFDMPLFALLKRSGVEASQLKTERWNELYGYERLQTAEPWLTDDVLPKLRSCPPQTVGTLVEGEVKVWQSRVVDLKLPEGHPPKFVDDEFMALFFKNIIKLADEIFGNQP